MNTKTKRRLVVVTGVIVIVLIVALAVIGGSTAAKTMSVADALTAQSVGERVQVSGNVVDNSFTTENNVLTFSIYDPDGDESQTLVVRYDGSASSTFGNGVTAICTGTLTEENGEVVLVASELVTKCPSKYETSTDALSVSRLVEYGDTVVDTTVKITGTVVEGTLTAAGSGEPRLSVADADDATIQLEVEYDGGLADTITDGSTVVITGSINADGVFVATDVAEEA